MKRHQNYFFHSQVVMKNSKKTLSDYTTLVYHQIIIMLTKCFSLSSIPAYSSMITKNLPLSDSSQTLISLDIGLLNPEIEAFDKVF